MPTLFNAQSRTPLMLLPQSLPEDFNIVLPVTNYAFYRGRTYTSIGGYSFTA